MREQEKGGNKMDIEKLRKMLQEVAHLKWEKEADSYIVSVKTALPNSPRVFHCPLSAIAEARGEQHRDGLEWTFLWARQAGRALGLGDDDVVQIMNAADAMAETPVERQIRKLMEEVLL